MNAKNRNSEDIEIWCKISSFLSGYGGISDGDKCVFRSIDEYISCIEKWGKIHNVVSAKYVRSDLLKNVYDSLAGGATIDLPSRVFDVGSGGGFPAIPLAILFPHITFDLVESSRKKCSFLRLVRAALGLSNVNIINRRVEELVPQLMVISKAAFSPANLKTLAGFCAKGGRLALWATPQSEPSIIAAAQESGLNFESGHDYEVPQLGRRRILVFARPD